MYLIYIVGPDKLGPTSLCSQKNCQSIDPYVLKIIVNLLNKYLMFNFNNILNCF